MIPLHDRELALAEMLVCCEKQNGLTRVFLKTPQWICKNSQAMAMRHTNIERVTSEYGKTSSNVIWIGYRMCNFLNDENVFSSMTVESLGCIGN